uniref:Uncharacterized protein n=1 Tax=Bactrocera dorsalis TaxID=27457 RepID=A0A034WVT7_BACDO
MFLAAVFLLEKLFNNTSLRTYLCTYIHLTRMHEHTLTYPFSVVSCITNSIYTFDSFPFPSVSFPLRVSTLINNRTAQRAINSQAAKRPSGQVANKGGSAQRKAQTDDTFKRLSRKAKATGYHVLAY